MTRFLIRRLLVALVRLVSVILALAILAEFSLSLVPDGETAGPRHVWDLAGSFDSDDMLDFLERSAASGRVLLVGWLTVIAFGLSIGVFQSRLRRAPSLKILSLPFLVTAWAPAFWLAGLAAIWQVQSWGHPGFADGEAPIGMEPMNRWWHAALLGVILALGGIGWQFQRCSEAIREGTRLEFIRSSFMDGHRRTRIFYQDILMHALPDLTGVLYRGLPATLGMMCVAEWALRYPGLGQYLVEAARSQAVAGVFLVTVIFSGVAILVTLLGEWLHGILDHQIHHEPYPTKL